MEARTMDSFNSDLKLLTRLTADVPRPNWPKPKNISQLATLLKYKNNPNNFDSKQVEKGRSWLRSQGIDIETIYSKIERRADTLATAQKRPAHEDSYFYVDLSLQNIPEYLQKSYQYSTMNLIQHVMTRGSNSQRRFISWVVDDLHHTEANQKFKISWAGERVPEQRGVYIQAVKNTVRRGKDYRLMISELLAQFRIGFYQYKDQSIWEILSSQLDHYAPHKDITTNLAALHLRSLQLVQSEFQKRLHGQDIERHLSVNYLHRIYGNSHEQREAVWGKTWLYMMAGLHKQALELIASRYRNYHEFINSYVKSYQSISLGAPTVSKLEARTDIKDIFYSQIVFCLNGESRYSNELLFDNHSLELIWLTLRTTAIYCENDREKAQKFEKLRQSIISSYKDCTSNPQLIKNMLYLLDYEAVIKLGPNIMMNQDDYLHFLIILNAYPTLASYPPLQKLLVEKLCEAIIELMVERREEYVYYIALLPTHCIVSEVSSIIISSDALDSMNWRQLRELLSEDIYLGLVKTTVARFVSIRGDYLRAAQKLNELIGEPILVIEYLISMLVRSNLGTQTFSQEQVLKAQQMGLELSSFEGHPYDKIFQLFVSSRTLKSILITRDETNLQYFISKNELIFLDNQAICIFTEVLEKLSSFGGIEVYFNFLRNAVKATQICTIRTKGTAELRNFKHFLLNTCHHLLESPKLAVFSKESGVEELLDYLNSNY